MEGRTSPDVIVRQLGSGEITTPEDVYEQLNLLKKLVAALDPDTDYQSAILQSINTLAEAIESQDMGDGGAAQAQLDEIIDLLQQQLEGAAVTTNLPVGLVGRSIDEIPNNQTGTGVFNLDGSQYAVRIEASESIERLEPITIVGDDNLVRPTTDLEDAVDDSVPTIGGDFRFRYNGKVLVVPRIAQLNDDIKVANQKYDRGSRTDVSSELGPGESKVLAEVTVREDEIFLFKRTNATSHPDVKYEYYIDDEEDPDPNLSGTVPWATPPEFFEVVDNGYRLVEQFVRLKLVNTSGTTSYDAVQGAITGTKLEV